MMSTPFDGVVPRSSSRFPGPGWVVYHSPLQWIPYHELANHKFAPTDT